MLLQVNAHEIEQRGDQTDRTERAKQGHQDTQWRGGDAGSDGRGAVLARELLVGSMTVAVTRSHLHPRQPSRTGSKVEDPNDLLILTYLNSLTKNSQQESRDFVMPSVIQM